MARGAALIALIAVVAMTLRAGLHKITEGHVGVYYRGGALLSGIVQPGFHVMIPFLDHVEEVQTTLQTDKVSDIPCGTSGGVMLHFDRVEVVNKLHVDAVHSIVKNYTVNYDKVWIFDKIHHEINQFCSKHTLKEIYIEKFQNVDDMLLNALQESCDKWAPGIEIVAVRITKPRIPPQIMKNFEQMEAEKSKLQIAVQAQKVVEKEAETERKRQKIEADTRSEVSMIAQKQKEMERESERRQSEIEDARIAHHRKTIADADLYSAQMVAEANKLLHTEQYVQMELAKAIANNTKVFFGDSMAALFANLLEQFQLAKQAPAKETNTNKQ